MRGVALAAALLAAFAQAPAPEPAPADPGALLDRLQAAWAARDLEGYLALWELATPEQREAEAAFARDCFSADDARLLAQRPAAWPAGERVRLTVQTFMASEPRGRVEQWALEARRTPAGWRVTARAPRGRIDGLVHLGLDPQGFVADGRVLKLPDFELRLSSGTLFTSPQSLGPTVLVFVGEGVVRFAPRPPTEREQLRQFWGQPELVERVKRVFVRIHPADLHRVLQPVELRPDPRSAARLDEAKRIYDEQAGQAFVLDANLPGSPWWTLPALGDALVVFESRKGALSFTIAGAQAEAVSLFDRRRRMHVCLYPAGAAAARYNEDDERDAEALSHDLSVRFDPQREALRAEDTLRVRLLKPTAALRLRLNDALRVESVTSAESGPHLFFRVRNQDSLVVSLGPSSGAGELTLKVVYGGTLAAGGLQDEVQIPGREPRYRFNDLPLDPVAIYSSRSLWYPHPALDDYATARLLLDVPKDEVAVAGGLRTSLVVGGERWTATYEQDQPAKYLAVAVGRLLPAGERRAGSVMLRAFATARRRGEGPELLQHAAGMLDFYATLFGPCPYTELNVVLIESDTPGGHSPPGMIVLTEQPVFARAALRDDPASFDDVPGFFLAHELAHQWWGQGVAGQNYRERWLSEGVAQYAAALWARHASGERTFQGVLRRFERWALRMTREGPINLGYRLGHIKQDPQIYRAVVYNKGAYVLHMLQGIVGEEAFLKALRAYQAAHRFAKAGTDDLRRALEEASGRELEAYFDAWIYGTELPRLRVSWRSEAVGGGQRTTVKVEPEHLPGPVPLEIAVVHAEGRTVRNVSLPPEGLSWTFDSPRKPSRVEVNANRALLAEIVGAR